MDHGLPPDMLEATRLTRAGRLHEATALLQRLFQGRPTGPAGGATPPTLDLKPEPVPEPEQGEGAMERVARVVGRLRREHRKPADVPLPAGARFLTGTHRGPHGSRDYRLYVPGGRGDRPMPLLVMLHGCTQSPEDFAAGTRMNQLAEERGCLVLYPAQSQQANPSRCWNWFRAEDQERGRGEPALVAGMVREVVRAHGADPRRVYVAGLSAGAAAATVLGAAYPDLFAAVGAHSGLPRGAARDMPSAFAAMQGGASAVPRDRAGRPVPTIVFHGDQDSTVNPRNADQVAAQAMAAAAGKLRQEVDQGGAPGGHAWRRVRHLDPGGRALVEQWTVNGAGHAWSGGSPAGSYTDARGPEASREMLRFFLEREPAVAATG